MLREKLAIDSSFNKLKDRIQNELIDEIESEE